MLRLIINVFKLKGYLRVDIACQFYLCRLRIILLWLKEINGKILIKFMTQKLRQFMNL